MIELKNINRTIKVTKRNAGFGEVRTSKQEGCYAPPSGDIPSRYITAVYQTT